MPWRPSYPGEVPTLGFEVLEWMQWALAAPDRPEYEPFTPTREQAQFILNLYMIDPRTGKRKYRRAVISRPKGWGKSPLLSAIVLAECLADVVPDGYDAAGRPVARPWRDTRTVWGQIMAVSEDQTKNAWGPLLEMVRNGPAVDLYPGIDPMESFVALPGAGRIEAVTAAAASREGNRPIICVLDQTESWTPTNGGVKLAATARRNLAKTGGVSIEAPNAYVPGSGSVAQESADFAAKIEAAAAGQGMVRDVGLLYDHRQAPLTTKLDDRESLLKGLAHAYGDSTWVDLDRFVGEIWDPATDPADARQYYLNQVVSQSDSWIRAIDWEARVDKDKKLLDKDVITLGFDGSQKDDATALVACRVSDGHLELLGCWAKPDKAGEDWQVDTDLVDGEVRKAFDRFHVIGFYCDPPWWQSYVDQWTKEFGPTTNTAVLRRKRTTIRVKASATKPFEWWTNRPAAAVAALERFETAVRAGELTHSGDVLLGMHVINAKRKEHRAGTLIGKKHPKSRDKIDAAMAAVLAFECRSDAVAQGVAGTRRGGGLVQRIN